MASKKKAPATAEALSAVLRLELQDSVHTEPI